MKSRTFHQQSRHCHLTALRNRSSAHAPPTAFAAVSTEQVPQLTEKLVEELELVPAALASFLLYSKRSNGQQNTCSNTFHVPLPV